MHVSNPHYEPRQTIEIFDDGLDNVEYPNFNDIKMKEDVQLPAVPSAHSRLHQPTFDRSKKEAVLQRQRQFVREQTTEVEKGIKKVMQMELDYNEVSERFIISLKKIIITFRWTDHQNCRNPTRVGRQDWRIGNQENRANQQNHRIG